MKPHLLNYLSVALWLLLAAQAAGDESLQPFLVPIDEEPRHRLALENDYVRASGQFFDRNDAAVRRIRNDGDDRFELIDVEIK